MIFRRQFRQGGVLNDLQNAVLQFFLAFAVLFALIAGGFAPSEASAEPIAEALTSGSQNVVRRRDPAPEFAQKPGYGYYSPDGSSASPLNSDALFAEPFSDFYTPQIRIGVLKDAFHNSYQDYQQFLERTEKAVSETFGGDEVSFRMLGRGDLAEAVRLGQLEFVIAPADIIAQIRLENNLRLIASFWPPQARNGSSVESSVFFTRAESLDIQSFAQIGDVPVAALSSSSFSGYLVPLYELSRRGYVSGYLNNVYFTGDSVNAVIKDVMSGEAAVGILPACVLERLEKTGKLSMSDFRIISPRRQTELQCAHSTDAFPSITVAALPRVDPRIEKRLATALYALPAGNADPQWALPAEMQAVLDVFYRLKIGPYNYLAQWSLQRFVRENSGAVTVAGLLLLMIVSYAAVLQAMVSRKTVALKSAFKERERIEKEVTDSREHIAALERTGIIGQMSSMIAHELKQPLGAINNFGNGLIRRLKRGAVSEEVLNDALAEIVSQGKRAAEIVDKVRSYAKHPDPVMQVKEIRPVLEKAVMEFQHSFPDAPPIVLHCHPYCWAEMDAWEFQLAVLNLLKNASEAIKGCEKPQIDIYLRESGNQWKLEVADNGKELTQERADLFFEPLQSGKISGMGLGLSIVANIAERLNGHASARPNTAIGHGCVMTIIFPKSESPMITTGKK